MGAVLPPADDPVSSGLDDALGSAIVAGYLTPISVALLKIPCRAIFSEIAQNLDCPGDRADQPEGHRTGIAATLRKSIEGP